MGNKPDFSGWATRFNIKCSDGRTIMRDAFKHCDGQKVPLFWNHEHNSMHELLGHALLEHRDEGMYAYGYFNDTEQGQLAKVCVQHGDVTNLSIFANRLKQQGGNVLHGMIRELSLVTAGANPGAYIDAVLMHGEDALEEASIFVPDEFVIENVEPLFHADKEEDSEDKEAEDKTEGKETVGDILATLNPKQTKAMEYVVGKAVEDALAKAKKDEDVEHSDKSGESAEDNRTIKEIFEEDFTEEEKKVAYFLIAEAVKDANGEEDDEDEDDEEVEHADNSDENASNSKTIKEIFDAMSEIKKKIVHFLIGEALKDSKVAHSDINEGGNDDMRRRIFEDNAPQGVQGEDIILSHSDLMGFVEDGYKGRVNSIKEYLKDRVVAALEETDEGKEYLQHGIENIDYLFPDAKNLNNQPDFIKRDDTWVGDVMRGVHHTPFSRIKTIHADITEADARAKGYLKGNLKMEELFKLLKRVTTPTTIYKKQKLDRDDVTDITDFDVIAWLKHEMRGMLDEEIARAIIVGDGRSASSQDKINELNIRPIWTDDDVYTVKAAVNVTSATTADEKAKGFIRECVKSRKLYKGSGNPIMLMDEDILTDCLLLEDKNGRVIYDSIDKLARAMRVSKIVTVPVMEGLTRTVGTNIHTLAGIYVNLNDYNVGADKGGAVNMFDDFDIDYNQMKYLMETRISGALTKPYSAVAVEFVTPIA